MFSLKKPRFDGRRTVVRYLLELQGTIEKDRYLTVDNVNSMYHRSTYRSKAASLSPLSNMANSALMSSSDSGAAKLIEDIDREL